MKRSIILSIVALFIPSAVFAWGGDGHQIINLIAEERLTPAARRAIHDLLGVDVDISDAEIASWADQIRRGRRFTAPWHYVNIPTTQPAFNQERDGRNGNTVIAKITEFEKVLADKTKPKQERVEALKFLVHFVGDIHQPLHCVDRNGDRGGNRRLVFVLNRTRAVSLHQVWDTQLLLLRKGNTRVLDYARTLNSRVTLQQIADWREGASVDWANESLKLAVQYVYLGVPEDGDPPKLDARYVGRGGALVDAQLQREGVRLAMILNRALRE